MAIYFYSPEERNACEHLIWERLVAEQKIHDAPVTIRINAVGPDDFDTTDMALFFWSRGRENDRPIYNECKVDPYYEQ